MLTAELRISTDAAAALWSQTVADDALRVHGGVGVRAAQSREAYAARTERAADAASAATEACAFAWTRATLAAGAAAGLSGARASIVALQKRRGRPTSATSRATIDARVLAAVRAGTDSKTV